MQCIRCLAMRILSVRPSVCLSVCLSVRPSVTRVISDKMEERSAQIFQSYERSFSLVFPEENGWWKVDLREIFGQSATVGAKSPIFNP